MNSSSSFCKLSKNGCARMFQWDPIFPGGVDSSMILALACRLKGPAINTYTVRVDEPEFDELSAASLSARHIGAKPPIVQEYGDREALESYPKLIEAAEAPVIDTACGALLKLAERVHANGQKVVLTGEGADEWLVGYPWYKAAKLMGFLDAVPGVKLSDLARRCYLRLNKVPHFPPEWRQRVEASIGGGNAWIDSYGMLAISKLRFYSEQMREVMNDSHPWGELGFPIERAKRWAPLNRGIWMAARVLLAGHLLQAKGDRVSMHSSVEVRYPFLDEDVFDFTARLHPRWKLRGFRDKYLLRLLAERWIPKSIARRHKVIFRAPLDSFHMDPEPPYVTQLLSEDSLRRTGYFDLKEVTRWRKGFRELRTEFAATTLGRNGTHRGRRHAALAPSIHGWWFGRSAGVVWLRKVFANSVAPLRTIPAFATSAARSLSVPGHLSPCWASQALFECTCAPPPCVPSAHRFGPVRCSA